MPARGALNADQRMGVFLVGLEDIRNHLSYVPAHLYRRPLSSEDHAAAERAEPAKEFHRQYVLPPYRSYVVERPFDLVYPASARFRCESSYQKKCDVNENGREKY
jgi:hypothetical protein